jgi:hypothetical protein
MNLSSLREVLYVFFFESLARKMFSYCGYEKIVGKVVAGERYENIIEPWQERSGVVGLREQLTIRDCSVHVTVWRRKRRYGCSFVGTNPASGSVTSGMPVSTPCAAALEEAGICCSSKSCSERFTKRPLTRSLRSAKFFRQP